MLVLNLVVLVAVLDRQDSCTATLASILVLWKRNWFVV